MSVLADLIGETVIDKDAQTTPVADIVQGIGPGGVLGLYFSAHWCPPCKTFTPELVEFYTKFRETDPGRKMDIIFISSDKDEASFKAYLKEMPWKAMLYAEKDRKIKMSKKYGVRGIPTLVFIEAETGKLITTRGRDGVDRDPTGVEFPWHPKSLAQILQGELLKGDDTVQIDEMLSGKVRAFFFSAHWCPPCQMFTPDLAKTYEKVKADGKNFEIVYVSSDSSEDSFKEYYKTMPWLALPFQDQRIEELSNYFEVEGIPTLILVNDSNELITSNGRSAVIRDPDGERFPWLPAPVEEIAIDNLSNLNENACLFLFTNGDAALQGSAVELMTDVAKNYRAAQKASVGTSNELPLLFFYYDGTSTESFEIAATLRMFVKVDDKEPALVLFDLSEERKFAMSAKGIDSNAISKIVEDFKTGKLQYEKLEL